MTINRIVFRNIVGIFVFLFLGMNNFGYAKEAKINKYIDDDVFYKMPEDDFVKMFTKVENWKDRMKPYIIKHKKNYYILKDPDKSNFSKIRVWFQNKELIKLEVLGWQNLPIFRETYDCTFYLKFYEIENGLYVGMTKKEFLNKFTDRIVGKFEEVDYAINAKGGGYREVSFEDDLLIHAPIIGPEDWQGWQKYLIKSN